jgi:hypothetical protein
MGVGSAQRSAPDAYARVTPASTMLAGLTPLALLLVGLAGDTGALHALLDVALVAWFVCFCVAMSIVFFNRPKWAVPPHLREQSGAVARWWRRLRTRTTR